MLRGDQFDPAYMKLNPNAVVPTLVHDGNVVIELTVIMHYVDEAFSGPSLMPSDALARGKVRMMTKLMDEYVHVACMTMTFATAYRAQLAGMPPHELEAELAKSPDKRRSEIKRQVVAHGLEAAPVVEALTVQEQLLDRIDAGACRTAPTSPAWTGRSPTPPPRLTSGGSTSSSSRACGTAGRAWRLVRAHPRAAVVQDRGGGLADGGRNERYANEPDPWPKVREILRAA